MRGEIGMGWIEGELVAEVGPEPVTAGEESFVRGGRLTLLCLPSAAAAAAAAFSPSASLRCNCSISISSLLSLSLLIRC